MREIKFRAWDKTGKNMLDWNVVKQYPLEDIIENVYGFELMQFTDSRDINKNDIYDADIIKNTDTELLQVVYWNKKEAAWYCRYVYNENRIVSLADSLGNLNYKIGNIHENPELLK